MVKEKIVISAKEFEFFRLETTRYKCHFRSRQGKSQQP